MKQTTLLLLSATLALLIASPAVLAEEGKAPAAKSPLRGEYAIMASELKLSDQQVADLAAKVKAKDEALAAWEKENGEKFKAAQEAAKKAKEGNDKEAAKKAAEELRALNEARAKIQSDAMTGIYALLTPEQKEAWEGFVLYRSAMARFRKAGLTEDQQKKVRELAGAAAKELSGATGDEKTVRQAKGQVQAKLAKDVEALLTAEQKEALKSAAKPADEKPAAEKKPTEKKPV
jgi:Spy/CpxP family protein refolding chaperone